MIRHGERVVVAMSGGVDSSVAAARLARRGCPVIGVTLDLGDGAGGAARAVASVLGVEHRVVDGRAVFAERVLRPSWEDFGRGRTPNPCVVCNAQVKWSLLLEVARASGAAWLATGHYARLSRDGAHRPVLSRGVDRSKDQSYFLFGVDREALELTIFPVGAMTKAEVRDEARRLGLPCAERDESQDACFAQDGRRLAEVLHQRMNAPERPGVFVDPAGRVLGRHGGTHLFTIGQRRGLRLALGRPAYVVAIRADRDEVVVSTDERDLEASGLTASGVRLADWFDPADAVFSCHAQIRYRSAAVPARVEIRRDGWAEVRFSRTVMAVTPGQAVVFYAGTRVAGGGWIEKPLGTAVG